MSTTIVRNFTHHPFGIKDERGREVGMLTWTTTKPRRWDPAARDGRGDYVDSEPTVYVHVQAARDGETYQASSPEVEIGPEADSTTASKARDAIIKRVAAARKRYERKYCKPT